MYNILAIFLMVCFFVGGCAKPEHRKVDVYTFKKDRVDQNMERGNRGYIMGTPPPVEERDTKRTLIGVDIELPGFMIPGEDADGADVSQVSVTQEEVSDSQEPETIVVEQEEIVEEEWIK